jgi:short-subunit dehydrogenase
VKGLTEALSVELAAHGVRAADVLPGIIETGMLPAELKAVFPKEGMWRVMPASAVAEAVWSAYESKQLHWYVPAELAEYDVEITASPRRRATAG